MRWQVSTDPARAALAVPVASALGSDGALWLAAGGVILCQLAMLAIPAVWAIQRPAS
jgi:hypothetical protein